MVKQSILAALFVSAASFTASGQQTQTWTGTITDNLCGAKHEAAAEGQAVPSDKECTIACVRGGSKYALLTADGKVHEFSNQDFEDLAVYAGDKVIVTGSMSAEAIKAEKIEKSR